MYLLGYDIGSSSIKASLLDAQTGRLAASASSPKTEMEMIVKKPGWAEQDPQMWWDNLKIATAAVLSHSGVNPADIKAIGISYQMHGLVLVDKARKVLRPSIIWCDSRAVKPGEKMADKIGRKKCLRSLLNYPGNFTASKLRWVIENEPAIYKRAHKFMLPGEYIAMKLGNDIVTTVPGLAEEMLWDYSRKRVSSDVVRVSGIHEGLIPEIKPTFSVQGEVGAEAGKELGLKKGTLISYRAGDQPNNALSLNVLEPGEVAATAGTSGVIFGITDKNIFDPKCRVNTFAHVSNSREAIRNGVMVCINGTGILNSWMKHNISGGIDYPGMNSLAATVAPGSLGLSILPYGNGAERTMQNREMAASVHGLVYNVHKKPHLLRAGQEGIVFALNYGFDVMKEMGMKLEKVRAGRANMFLSPVFREAFANTCGVPVELYDTDGAQGAARGAGIGAGIYKDAKEAFRGLKKLAVIAPEKGLVSRYKEAYKRWKTYLKETA